MVVAQAQSSEQQGLKFVCMCISLIVLVMKSASLKCLVE